MILGGCPLTPEGARVPFLDAFWSDLELLWGVLGGALFATFRCSFRGVFLERLWSGVLHEFGSILGHFLEPFWRLLGGAAEKCH